MKKSIRYRKNIRAIKKLFSRKLEAFTLMELLFALVIIGFLVYMAMPDYSSLTTKAKSVEAKLQLEHLHTLEKTYYFQYSKYSTSFSDIGYEQQKLSTDGGRANYKIEIDEANGNSFKARATSVVDFNGNGIFNVWEVDQDKNMKEVTPD